MACTTIDQVRKTWPPPDPTNAILDADVQMVIDEVCELYAGDLLTSTKGKPDAVRLHVAHILWLGLNMSTSGPVPFGAPVVEADLDGVGKLKFAIANLTPAQLADIFSIPSPYVARLNNKRHSLPPAVMVV